MAHSASTVPPRPDEQSPPVDRVATRNADSRSPRRMPDRTCRAQRRKLSSLCAAGSPGVDRPWLPLGADLPPSLGVIEGPQREPPHVADLRPLACFRRCRDRSSANPPTGKVLAPRPTFVRQRISQLCREIASRQSNCDRGWLSTVVNRVADNPFGDRRSVIQERA